MGAPGGCGTVHGRLEPAIYYDRHVPDPLLELLLPTGPLAWLMPWLESETARCFRGHIQTRRNEGDRKQGGLQIYFGRTSPVELRPVAPDTYRFHANKKYKAKTPELFARPLRPTQISELEPQLRGHLEIVAASADDSLVRGEALVHGGMMRHYGPLADPDATWQAVDSEARMGFVDTPAQEAFQARLRQEVGLPAREAVPQKLDALGIDRDGRLLLVEVKKDHRGMARAGWQAAVHHRRFTLLLDEQPDWPERTLAPTLKQKQRCGLLRQTWGAPVLTEPPVVPVVAAPDTRSDWHVHWRRALAPVAAAAPEQLRDLLLWRVDGEGRVLEEVRL